MIKRFYLITLALAAVILQGCDQTRQESVNTLPAFARMEASRLVLTQGALRMEVLPACAGRIGSFRYDGHEILIPVGDLDKSKDWGTVLWSSPQAEWNWPPIDVLDNKPYTLSVSEDKVVLTSDLDPKTGYQFSKSYSLADNAIAVTYRIFNRSTVGKKVGALEVTRLPAAGSVFFPHGNTEPTSGIFYPLAVQEVDGLTWFTYAGDKIRNDHHKIMEDGKEGWVAYTNKGYVLVKEFADNPPEVIADGEREIEVFAHVDHTFVEMKQQSAAAQLAPGEHLEWTVIWRLAKLPADLQQSPQPKAMADFVRRML